MKTKLISRKRYLNALVRLAKLGDREWTIADGRRAFGGTEFAHPFVKRLRDNGLVRKLKPGRNRYLLTAAGFKAAASGLKAKK